MEEFQFATQPLLRFTHQQASMSDSSADVAELIAQASQIRFSVCVNIAGTALIFYDYVLTFSTEVSEIWNSKFSGAHTLFYLNRYSYIISTILGFPIGSLIIQTPFKTFSAKTQILTYHVDNQLSSVRIQYGGVVYHVSSGIIRFVFGFFLGGPLTRDGLERHFYLANICAMSKTSVYLSHRGFH
ncbi:hypothetical protein BD410DRAFT_489666 [Rickenella mellea]|uniref:DUF6533 domain-containing protein n=1 Tax=Rickenella mellea TaxID=50990 RepID=A0A4Y7PVN1_9AGAM|nr:hypothetical protein BD410DRAFT_489666 [Rickenella mellea]